MTSLLRPVTYITRCTTRQLCSDRLSHTEVPGLVYVPRLLPENIRAELEKQALELHEKICDHRPMGSLHTPKEHNLPFRREYALIHFEDSSGKKINAQNFVDYGSKGHDLTYFRDNPNVPNFVQEELISRIAELQPVNELSKNAKNPLNWRFTFNVYRKGDREQAGFDWHKDIESNGVITSITTLFGQALFEIRPEGSEDFDKTCILPLTPGSTILLSGDSRWKWEHRVLAQKVMEAAPISRISMVLGCRPQEM